MGLNKLFLTVGCASLFSVLCTGCSNDSPVSVGESNDQVAAATSVTGLSTGLISIYSLGYQGTSSKYVSATNRGAGPLVANQNIIGSWEQYVLSSSSGNTFTIMSMANNKYVTKPSGTDGPLIASSSTIGNAQRWIIESVGTDTYRLSSSETLKSWITSSSGQINASGIYGSSAYRILTDRIPGSSSSAKTATTYDWNSTYLMDHRRIGTSGGGVCYRFKVSNALAGTTLSLYIDGAACGTINVANGQNGDIRVYSLKENYNLHNITIKFNKTCTLDEFSWYIPTGI
jgi:hypothetical protein